MLLTRLGSHLFQVAQDKAQQPSVALYTFYLHHRNLCPCSRALGSCAW